MEQDDLFGVKSKTGQTRPVFVFMMEGKLTFFGSSNTIFGSSDIQ
jgi:hypothetical protein